MTCKALAAGWARMGVGAPQVSLSSSLWTILLASSSMPCHGQLGTQGPAMCWPGSGPDSRGMRTGTRALCSFLWFLSFPCI